MKECKNEFGLSTACIARLSQTDIKTTINEKSLLKNENVSGILTLKAAITNIN